LKTRTFRSDPKLLNVHDRLKNQDNKRNNKPAGPCTERGCFISQVPLILDSMLAVKPQPKPRRCHHTGVDQSIMEMQMIYPDLAFRGRPLRPGKPQRANGSSKDVHAPNTNDNSGDGKAAEVPKVAAATRRSRNDGSKADDVGDDCRGSGCSDRNRGGGPAAGDAISGHVGTTDGSAGDGGLRGPQALSLHITLRAASIAEQSLKPGEAPPTAAPPAHAQQPTIAGTSFTHAYTQCMIIINMIHTSRGKHFSIFHVHYF